MDPALRRRNIVLLAAGMAALFGVVQLVAAVGTITFVAVTGIEELLGLAPALMLGAGAVAAFPAGRAMDRLGRVPVLACGFAFGAVGGGLVAISVSSGAALPVLAGFVLIGAANGVVNLSRTAAGDMYPPATRARGISIVVFGSLFGALLGPTLFMPLFGGLEGDSSALATPWLLAGGVMTLGMVLVLNVRLRYRPAATGSASAERAPGARPLGLLVRRPGVGAALGAAVTSFAVMVAVMNLSGHIVVGHGHPQDHIFPVVAAHFLGMFGLALVVGDLVDRIGRPQALAGGLLLISASCVGLIWAVSIPATAASLFGIGLGWSFSYVAATAQLSDVAKVSERGRILGLSDALSFAVGAGLALLGGFALSTFGVATLGAGAALIAAAPVLWGLARPRLRPAEAEA